VSDLPTGTVTFLFTDIEGSTRLIQELGEGYGAVQDRHAKVVRDAFETEDGHEVRTEGDSFFAVFRTPGRGVRAAIAAQRRLAEENWAHGGPLRVRMGLHTGEGVLGGGDYIGIDVNRAARIAAAAHGGQVLISDATRVLVGHALPEGGTIRDLGSHRLKDFDEPRPLYDLVIDGLPADFRPIRTLGGPRRTNLPPPRTSFVGRERELAEIGELLTRTRLLTLTGPGGTGRTRLALRAAAEQIDRVDEGAFIVDLSAVTDPALVPSSIAASLGVRKEPGADLLDTLAGHFRDRDLLLVLDNLEHVVEAAPAVDRLLEAAPRLRILATSRIPLHLSGEHEYLVGPLPLPDPARRGDLDVLTTSESVRLFVERAASVRRDFSITEENAAAVAEIVRRLDGLPLAIELAAGRVKMLSAQALLERLEHRLPLLTGGRRDVPERQRTCVERSSGATTSWSRRNGGCSPDWPCSAADGPWSRPRQCVAQPMAIHRERGDRVATAEANFMLAGFKLMGGDADAAWGHLRETVTILLEPRSPAPMHVAMALTASLFTASHDGDHERAARLLGAGNRIGDEGASYGPPRFVLAHFGDPEAAARAALGDEAFDRAHVEGYAMTMDQVRSYAIEVVARPDR
jgi:class 3 adenylate cyclase